MDPYLLPDLAATKASGAAPRYDIVEIRGLRLPFMIGVFEFEKHRPQSVVIDVAMAVDPAVRRAGDYVSYAPVADLAISLSKAEEHIELVETLAEKLLAQALADTRVARARVSVMKADIYPQADAVGVTIEGLQSDRGAA
ncbi:MAG: dihydroneopterin aldolase [Neomegalonema sp.]|nr:dihydroneopterin aldolase [Neomegalonema sp.]